MRIIGAVLATVSRNGELALGVGLRHGKSSIGGGKRWRERGDPGCDVGLVVGGKSFECGMDVERAIS